MQADRTGYSRFPCRFISPWLVVYLSILFVLPSLNAGIPFEKTTEISAHKIELTLLIDDSGADLAAPQPVRQAEHGFVALALEHGNPVHLLLALTGCRTQIVLEKVPLFLLDRVLRI